MRCSTCVIALAAVAALAVSAVRVQAAPPELNSWKFRVGDQVMIMVETEQEGGRTFRSRGEAMSFIQGLEKTTPMPSQASFDFTAGKADTSYHSIRVSDRMFNQTRVEYVMVIRAAFGNPVQIRDVMSLNALRQLLVLSARDEATYYVYVCKPEATRGTPVYHLLHHVDHGQLMF